MDNVTGLKDSSGDYIPSFTVDVEDGVSIAMRDAFGVNIAPTERVVRYTDKLLAVFSEMDTKGTFFILGIIAEHFPDLIQRIADEGHELGVHGYDHLLFSKTTPDVAYQEVDGAKKLIEDISGQKVYGHRAPAFSVNTETSWAFDLLARCGFTYDSSVMPCKGLHYGWPGFHKQISRIQTSKGNQIIEVPMSTVKIMGRDVPACGGSYLRLVPYFLTKRFFSAIRKENHPIIYIHPYELDTDRYPDYFYEELQQASWKTNIGLRANWMRRSTVKNKIKRLMALGGSKPLADIVSEAERSNQITLYQI